MAQSFNAGRGKLSGSKDVTRPDEEMISNEGDSDDRD
jgi:hypothetical protein